MELEYQRKWNPKPRGPTPPKIPKIHKIDLILIKSHKTHKTPKMSSNFQVKDVETTEGCQQIRKYVTWKTSLIYFGLVVQVGDISDGFMQLLQSSKSVIHVLYATIGDWLFNVIGNFMKHDKFVDSAKSRKMPQRRSLSTFATIEIWNQSTKSIS